ncbi:hypothetical protein ACFQX6_05610 [Streptosporangium lutulentum]
MLAALYRRVDDQQTEAATTALRARARSLEETVRILAEAYIDCVLHIGKEFGAVTAALSSIAGTEELLRRGGSATPGSTCAPWSVSRPCGKRGDDTDARRRRRRRGAGPRGHRGRLSRAEAVRATERIMLGAVNAAGYAAAERETTPR